MKKIILATFILINTAQAEVLTKADGDEIKIMAQCQAFQDSGAKGTTIDYKERAKAFIEKRQLTPSQAKSDFRSEYDRTMKDYKDYNKADMQPWQQDLLNDLYKSLCLANEW
jgi:hypothetical protein